MKKKSLIFLLILILLSGCNMSKFGNNSVIDAEKKIISYHENKLDTILSDVVKLDKTSIEISMKIKHIGAKQESDTIGNYEISAVNIFITSENLDKKKRAAINSTVYNYFKNITVGKNINVVINEIPKEPKEKDDKKDED